MVNQFWLSTKQRAAQALVQFGKDTGNVFNALGVWSILFLLVEIILGFLPLVSALTLGKTVDAMIGARGIGVVTSDVNTALTHWLIVLLVGFVAYLFTVRFTGKAADVGRAFRDVVLFVSLLGYFVTIHQLFLAFVFLVVLGADTLFSDLRVKIASLLLTLITGSLVAHTLIRYTVARAFTVGEGLAMIGAIALFVVFLKLKLAYAPHN